MPVSHLLDTNERPHGPNGSAVITVRHGKIPAPLTPFVGRQQELAVALALLQQKEVRLLTLTGPGGVGKTRLAIEIAERASNDFPHGVFFIELASITDPDRLIPTIAREFALPEIGDRSPVEALSALFRGKRSLLVLDNYDQIVAAAPALSELLAACPGLSLLVTSRIVLNIQGEHEFQVAPLPVPEPCPGRTWRALSPDDLAQYDSASLFLQRARAVRPDFVLTRDNSVAVATICRQLDGLPLAIELAAARLKILTPEALMTRLAHRLDILTGGARDQPPRLQAMRSAIAWSYELLDPFEQELFQRLAVFVGGFTLDAAEFVCRGGDGDLLSGIASLVDNSLLRRVESSQGDFRFVMLETIREFGLEQLAATRRDQETHRAFVDWYREQALQSEARIFGPNDMATLDQLEAEHDNILSALEWSLEYGWIDTGLHIACWVWPLWLLRSYVVEGHTWLERLCQRGDEAEKTIYALALSLLGVLTEGLGDFERALQHVELGARIARAQDDRRCLGRCLLAQADVVEEAGDIPRSKILFEESLVVLRETGEEGWMVSALTNLALLSHRQGDSELAEQYAEEALEISRRIGFAWGLALSLNRQGLVVADEGDFERSAQLFQESLLLWNDVGDRWRVALTLSHLADIAAQSGRLDYATRLLGAADTLNEMLAVSQLLADSSGWHRARRIATEQLDAATYQQLWDEGHHLSWDEVIELATAPFTIGTPTSETVTSTAPATGTLSPREFEVLRLLVEGNTDREIAESLFISPRTAQGHVANIFNKLGVNSRTAAVATALQSGLLPSNGPST